MDKIDVLKFRGAMKYSDKFINIYDYMLFIEDNMDLFTFKELECILYEISFVIMHEMKKNNIDVNRQDMYDLNLKNLSSLIKNHNSFNYKFYELVNLTYSIKFPK